MLASILHRVAFRAVFLLPRRDTRGIRIHFVLAPEKRDEYFARVDKALGLLQKYDSRRFARLAADVRAIVILPVADFPGALNSTTRICLLSGQLLLEDKGGIATATTLAHEAQHARLLRCGFSTSRYGVNRIEGVCKRAELHFLLRLPPFTDRDRIIAMAEAAHAALRHDRSERVAHHRPGR